MQDSLSYLLSRGYSMDILKSLFEKDFSAEEIAAAERKAEAEGRTLCPQEEPEPWMDEPTQDQLLPNTKTAQELMAMDLPPVQWIVRDLLPVGSSAIVAASKIGKSWMILDILLTVALGGSYMGHDCPQAGVLYLALEDSDNRLQSRMDKVLNGRQAPAGFYYATEWNTLDTGFYEALERWIGLHSDVKIVAIDVLQRVRGSVKAKESSYGADYREIGGLKRFFDAHGLSLILVHHTRKNTDSADPYDAISGTNGIMGALDTVWVILKDRRDDEHATLHIIGRDVNQQELTIRFNKDTGRWENLGSTDWFQEQRQREEYEKNPLVVTIKELLVDKGIWRGSSSELLKETLHIAKYDFGSASTIGRKIKPILSQLEKYDGIRYDPVKNGTGSATHVFAWGSQSAEQEVAADYCIDNY